MESMWMLADFARGPGSQFGQIQQRSRGEFTLQFLFELPECVTARFTVYCTALECDSLEFAENDI